MLQKNCFQRSLYQGSTSHLRIEFERLTIYDITFLEVMLIFRLPGAKVIRNYEVGNKNDYDIVTKMKYAYKEWPGDTVFPHSQQVERKKRAWVIK